MSSPVIPSIHALPPLADLRAPQRESAARPAGWHRDWPGQWHSSRDLSLLNFRLGMALALDRLKPIDLAKHWRLGTSTVPIVAV